MKLLHTADWHLGHQLHGHDRTYEHARFFDWLLTIIAERGIDALLIAGDVFDTANPSAASWQLFYRFLARLRARHPRLNIVIIGGNHDSPSKLDAPHELLKAFDLHLVGSVQREASGELDLQRLLVPLTNPEGNIEAWCAAVPYLRSADLRLEQELAEGEDRLVEGVRQIYRQTLAALAARRQPGQALIALGHGYLVSGQLSELSERKVLGGNQHALPMDIFEGADYVALGHLHLAQSLSPTVHYSGSPLPLALAEQAYRHQVLEVSLEHGRLAGITRLPVPRVVDIVRLPSEPAPLAEVELALLALDLPELPQEQRPFLEVRVLLEQPEPRLRERILALLADKPVRLARISTSYTGQGGSAADRLGAQQLDELTPEAVFRLCYQRQYQGEPGPELLRTFDQLLSEYQEQSR